MLPSHLQEKLGNLLLLAIKLSKYFARLRHEFWCDISDGEKRLENQSTFGEITSKSSTDFDLQ